MNYTKWLNWGIIGGLFLALFVPFIIAAGPLGTQTSLFSILFAVPNLLFPVASFFPYITGKNFIFRIIVEIVFGLYIILAIRDA